MLRDAHVWGAWVVVVANRLVALRALGAPQWPALRHRLSKDGITVGGTLTLLPRPQDTPSA